MVSSCDCSISEVNDLVAILEMPDQLSLSSNDSHSFTLVAIHTILINHRLLFRQFFVLYNGLLNVSIWLNLDNKSIWESECHACSLVWIVIRI